MLISLNWLKDFVQLPENIKSRDLGSLLTLKTAEVEKIHHQKEELENIVIGQVLELQPHPNADKLQIAKTSIGKETLNIVCGGSNLKEGMYTAVAKIGASIKWHGEGAPVVLEKTKIRGIESHGMICAGAEIGIPTKTKDEKEILDLSALKPKIGTNISELKTSLFKNNDTILEFDNKSLTHRPDLWGHYGIALEVSAITNSKFKHLRPNPKIPSKGETVKIKVENPKLCPRYCGLIINNIKVQESPEWLKTRLQATEHGTHNNIVDITNYVMTDLGQPMHAFDKNFIQKNITVRCAKKKEKITTLDNIKRTLSPDMLVIADDKKPIAIAGVIGGENSEISKNTTSIILESANFNAESVRKTSTKLGVRTDSVQRFEKSLDPNLAEFAIKRATELILQICPEAKIAGPITDISNFDKTPLKIKLFPEKVYSKIGIKITEKEIKEILEKLLFKVEKETKKNKTSFIVTVPTWRASGDISTQDDLIEEIARIYGYEKIPETLPVLPTSLPKENNERTKKHFIRKILSYGLGFDEIYSYSFYGENELKKYNLTEKTHLKLLNSLSEDQSHLRISLIPNLLKILEKNTKHFKNIKIYEIGRVFKDINEYFPLEEKHLAGGILEKKSNSKTSSSFFKAKGVIETLLKKLNLENSLTPISQIENSTFSHPSKAISYINKSGETLAKIYILHPSISKNFDLEKFEIALFEINLTKLLKLKPENKKFKPLPKFPSIKIDISVVIDKKTEAKIVEQAIQKADENLITKIKLFDIYEGEKIPSNKKALAFNIYLQSTDRTLTDKEMSKIQTKIFKNLEKINGKIRGKI